MTQLASLAQTPAPIVVNVKETLLHFLMAHAAHALTLNSSTQVGNANPAIAHVHVARGQEAATVLHALKAHSS